MRETPIDDGTVAQEISRHVGVLIRQRRIERGLSIRALAREVGVDWSYLARVERGQVSARLSYIRRVTEPLGCTLRVQLTPREHAFGVEICL